MDATVVQLINAISVIYKHILPIICFKAQNYGTEDKIQIK